MEIIIQPTKADAVDLTARIVDRRIREKPALVLGLATGRTMEPVYADLVRRHREEGLDFGRVHTFNLDEYVGLPPEHDQSYRYFMNHQLFDHINIPMANTRLPDGMAADIPAECAAYEAAIAALGGVDLQLLGIGSDGHIGFNEPMSAIRSRTRIKTLTRETVAQNGPLFGDPKLMPLHALTMGVGTILESQECLMLVTGEGKAAIVAEALEGPISSMVTASALQLHPRTVVVLDEAAAANLRLADYYRWTYENKPAWQRVD
jgi:glucosamine-6-phosphate deaminase